jgi:hypothetical protein
MTHESNTIRRLPDTVFNRWLPLWALLLWLTFSVFIFTHVGGLLADYADVLVYGIFVIAFFLTSALHREILAATLFHLQCLFSFLPVSFLFTEILFIIYTLLRLGHLPYPNQPDPNMIGLGLATFAVVWLVAWAVCLAIYTVILRRTATTLWTNPARHRACWTFCVLVWLLFRLVWRFDPLGFFEWLGD